MIFCVLFVIVILEVNIVISDKEEERLGIPDFMKKTSTYHSSRRPSTARSSSRARNFDEEEFFVHSSKRNSLDSREIRATRRRKKVDKSLTGTLKKHWKGLAITMGLGALLLSGVEAVEDNIHEVLMVSQNPVVEATHRAINSHKSRTDDDRNWYLNVTGVVSDVDTILDNGGDPLIVLGALASGLDENYTQDELSNIVQQSFGEEPDELVRSLNPERYADGIQGTNFREDVRDYIVQQTEADIARSNIDSKGELEAMFNFTPIENSVAKGMGGK